MFKLMYCVLMVVSSICLSVERATDVPDLVEKVLQQHPAYSSVDEKVVMTSHQLMFDLFDPQKIYLLSNEVEPFISPAHGKQFFQEFSRHSLASYTSIIEVCQKAIERARAIRQSLSMGDLMVQKRPSHYDGYAKSVDELKKRVVSSFFSMIEDRLPADSRGKVDVFQRARASAEQECCLREKEWLFQPSTSNVKEIVTVRWILKSFMEAIDAHSDIMNVEEARATRERLTKEGVGTGLTVALTRKGWMISWILEGSPAAEDGVLQTGDILVALNGKPCLEMSAQEIDAQLHESRGIIHVDVLRQGNGASTHVQAALLRKPFTIQEGRVEWEVRKTAYGNIAILRLHAFYRNGDGISSEIDLRNAFDACMEQAALSGVILDLRDNGGGYITEGVRVSGLFIKTGVVMMARYSDGSSLVFRDVDKTELFSGPLIILTSKETASAAEIVAQSLKDYGRAIIVGDKRTYGKGTIQTQNVTEGRSKTFPLRMTVGAFFTVGGSSPQGGGVQADIIVPSLWLGKKVEQENSKPLAAQPPLFHDTLQDVGVDSLPWYHEQYLPFLEQKTDRDRQWVPELRRRSESRLQHSLVWSLFAHKPSDTMDRKAWRKREQAAQLDEAVDVMQDLLMLKEIPKKG